MKCPTCKKKAKMTYNGLCHKCYTEKTNVVAEAIDAAEYKEMEQKQYG